MSEHDGWTVTVEAAGDTGDVDDDRIALFATELADRGGTVSGAQDGSRYGATFSVTLAEASTPEEAAAFGVEHFIERATFVILPEWPIVRLEVQTFAEHDADLAQPAIPELVGVSEIAEILAVSRQRAHQLTKRDDFPKPLADLAAGPVWAKPHLHRFIEKWQAPKPDVADQVAELDALIARLKDERNQLVHGLVTEGDIDAAVSTTFVEWVLDDDRPTAAGPALKGALAVHNARLEQTFDQLRKAIYDTPAMSGIQETMQRILKELWESQASAKISS